MGKFKEMLIDKVNEYRGLPKEKQLNVFDKAPISELPTEDKVVSKRKEIWVDGLDEYAAISVLIDSLNSISTMYGNQIKTQALEEFSKEMMEIKKRPDNFKGVGQVSEASIEMRRRSSNSYLKHDEIDLFTKYGIPMEEEIIKEDLEERYFFNPDILSSQEIAQKISDKLLEIPELKDKKVIMRQVKREGSVKKKVCDKSFDAIAQIENIDLVRRLLQLVSTLSIKPKLEIKDLEQILDLVRRSGIKL